MGQDISQGMPAEIQGPLESLGITRHLETWRPERERGQAGQWLEHSPGFGVLTCIDLGGHMARHRDASFRALHLDPTVVAVDAEQQQVWREWLRQGNLFQFLPHMLLSTAGFTGAEIDSVDFVESSPDALRPEAGESAGAPQPSTAWAESLSFAANHAKNCLDLLVALQSKLDPMGVHPPEFGYELEGPRGESCEELEMAWPAHQVAVVLDDRLEAPPEGWSLFPIDTPAEVVLAAIQL
jgi:DEAD/DEAH box helicase domain-containing protein